MAYVNKRCSNCRETFHVYHNVRRCRRCGDDLLSPRRRRSPRKRATSEEEVRDMLHRATSGEDRAFEALKRAAARLKKHRRRATYYRNRLVEMVNARMSQEAAASSREHRRIEID